MSPTIDRTFLINLRKKVSSRDGVGKFTVLTNNQITSLLNNPIKSLQELKNILDDGHPYLDEIFSEITGKPKAETPEPKAETPKPKAELNIDEILNNLEIKEYGFDPISEIYNGNISTDTFRSKYFSFKSSIFFIVF